MSLFPKEFCIKLSMASIEGRPLSVSLARMTDPDNELIGWASQNKRFVFSGCVLIFNIIKQHGCLNGCFNARFDVPAFLYACSALFYVLL